VREVSGERIIVSAGNKIITEQPLEMVLKRTVISKDHYAPLKGRPRPKPMRVTPLITSPEHEVEQRPLAEYAALAKIG